MTQAKPSAKLEDLTNYIIKTKHMGMLTSANSKCQNIYGKLKMFIQTSSNSTEVKSHMASLAYLAQACPTKSTVTTYMHGKFGKC